MLLSRRSNTADDYAFFSKLDLGDKEALHSFRKEFLEHMRNGLHGDFDRGYFSAWADCMRILTRMDIPSAQSSNGKETGEEEIETLRSDKSQVTMANFLQKSTSE
jgi:hypothetical protein